MAKKIVYIELLSRFWEKAKTYIDSGLTNKVDKVSGKQLSTNDFTTEEKNKLAGLQKITVDTTLNKESVNPVQNKVIATKLDEIVSQGGEPNTIEVIKKNGTALNINAADKSVDITVPTKTSQLTNDSNFATKNDISSVYKFKGTVNNYEELPITGQVIGDTYNCNFADKAKGIKVGDNLSWDGKAWDNLSGTVDLTNYYDMTQYPLATEMDIDAIFA